MSTISNYRNALSIAVVAGSLFLTIVGSAQVTSQTINQRKENQQDRIAQGVKSGQLTAGETANLERREASINKEEHAMRKQDDGHLTAGDKAALTRRQNRVSKSIYKDKHNRKVQ